MIKNSSLTDAKNWIAPTVQEVEIILNEIAVNYDLIEHEISDLIGVNERTIRRWKSKSKKLPLEPSKIPYSEWCKLILLARDKLIFSNVIDCEIEKIPSHMITNFKHFKGISAEDADLLIGKMSLSGLTKGEIANIFQWSAAYLGRAISENSANFSMIAMVLILCGVKKEKIFYTDKTIRKEVKKQDPIIYSVKLNKQANTALLSIKQLTQKSDNEIINTTLINFNDSLHKLGIINR